MFNGGYFLEEYSPFCDFVILGFWGRSIRCKFMSFRNIILRQYAIDSQYFMFVFFDL